jgi:hypothetical protein
MLQYFYQKVKLIFLFFIGFVFVIKSFSRKKIKMFRNKNYDSVNLGYSGINYFYRNILHGNQPKCPNTEANSIFFIYSE